MSFKYLRRAMENDDLGLDDPATMVPETAVELSDGIVAATEEEAEVNDIVGDIGQGMEASDQIEGTSEVFEASLDPESTGTGQEEGVSPETVAVAQESIGRILNKLGIPRSQVFPSLESFSGRNRSSRVTATRYAIEGFKETVKNIWQAIKDMFKKLWEKIKGFFSKFFANAEKLEKRATELKKTVFERTNGKKTPTDKVKNQGIATKLQDSEGKCSPDIAIARLESLIKLGDLPKVVGTAVSELVSGQGTVLSQYLKKATSSNTEDANSVNANISKKLMEIVSKTGGVNETVFKALGEVSDDKTNEKINDAYKKEFENYDKDGSQIASAGPFVDGKFMMAAYLTKSQVDERTNERLVTAVTFKLFFENPFDRKADESMDAMTPKHMEDACTKVKELALKIQAIQKEQKTSDSVMSNGIKLAENAIAMAETTNEDSVQSIKSAIGVLKGIVTSASSVIATVTTSLPITMFSGGAKALDYVTASMKLYK